MSSENNQIESTMPSARRVLPAHRRAIMLAAHRARRALGISMSEALRWAWAAFRLAQRCGWPLDRLTLPHERLSPPPPRKPLRTISSGRLAWSFAA
jgi:hypothetical protein